MLTAPEMWFIESLVRSVLRAIKRLEDKMALSVAALQARVEQVVGLVGDTKREVEQVVAVVGGLRDEIQALKDTLKGLPEAQAQLDALDATLATAVQEPLRAAVEALDPVSGQVDLPPA